MIKEMAESIIATYDQSSLPQVVDGGLYFQQAPDRNIYPSAVFYIMGLEKESKLGAATDGSKQIFSVDIQFNLFSDKDDGGENISLLHESFMGTYDFVLLTIEGFHCVKMERMSSGPIIYTDKIWQISMFYESWIVKE